MLKLDRLWIMKMLHPRDPETGELVRGSANGATVHRDWKDAVRAEALAKGQSAKQAESLIEAFEEQKRTLKDRAAAALVRINAERARQHAERARQRKRGANGNEAHGPGGPVRP